MSRGFLKYGYNFGNFEMDKPRGLKFFREVKYQKIFDTCPGVFLNCDQGPDGA